MAAWYAAEFTTKYWNGVSKQNTNHTKRSMKKIGGFILCFLAAFVFQHCSDSNNDPNPQPIREEDKGLAARWADVTLATVRASFPGSPTYTSRSLGYIGLTMYESVVHGTATRRSLAGQLNELVDLPKPEQGKEYNWALALNAGQAFILKSLYPHAQSHAVVAIEQLESETYAIETHDTDDEVAERSVLFGRAVAAAIYEWSKSDGGHQGYLRNFDPAYAFPKGDSYWAAPLFAGQSPSLLPLHPYWGDNRTFIKNNAGLPVPRIAPYSRFPSSDYHQFFREVYEKRNSLTEEEREIAAWWADDPTQTASPPGHSYNLATIAVTSAKADLFIAAETYAKVGMAVADAFICCWKCKYTWHSERPVPYIIAFIDKEYQQFWPEPPFPAFPSGHATQSAASAIALISVFGNDFPLADNTYENRLPDYQNIPYKTRKYNNFWATATECAYSRFLGGIHTRQDNETGTRQGKDIGQNVVSLSWKK
jgi:hypothetical protein